MKEEDKARRFISMLKKYILERFEILNNNGNYITYFTCGDGTRLEGLKFKREVKQQGYIVNFV